MRLPTGDEMNLLGSGAASLQPFAIWSGTCGKVSPHVNVGYHWNGSSVLAGNPATGESAHFPDQFSYAAGSELGVNARLTLAFDVLGVYTIDAPRLRPVTFRPSMAARRSRVSNSGAARSTPSTVRLASRPI